MICELVARCGRLSEVRHESSCPKVTLASCPKVTLIVAMRNEERYIGATLEAIVAQDYHKNCLEVLVVDSMSADRSVAIAEEICASRPLCRVITNPGMYTACAWNVGIRDPRNEQILASVSVKDNESVFTSGDYERVYNYQGKRYHHILNPNTGYPTQDAQSVTVIHDNPGLADAAATAIFVAGSEEWPQIAKQMGVRYVMLIDSIGNIQLSSAMQKRIKFLNKSPTSHIIIRKQL